MIGYSKNKGSIMKSFRFQNGLLGLAFFAALLLLNGCTTVPVTGRHELNLVSSGAETQLGLSSFDQLKKDTTVSRDPAINVMVQRVGKRIAEVAGKDLPGAQWEF